MNIVIRHTEDCPNIDEAEARVRAALRSLGVRADVSRQVVRTSSDAQLLGFPGSPTIVVEGVDLFADPTGTTGLACRLYETGDGLRGVPSLEQVIEALVGRSEPVAS
jgi:hypothetical protein